MDEIAIHYRPDLSAKFPWKSFPLERMLSRRSGKNRFTHKYASLETALAYTRAASSITILPPKKAAA